MNALSWESWGTAYGTSVDIDDGPSTDRSGQVNDEVELPAAAWKAIPPPDASLRPDVVTFVDGVMRNDARGWLTDDAGDTHPVLAASYAAGAVRCDRRRGVAEVIGPVVERALLSAMPDAPSIGTEPARYAAHRASRDAAEHLDRDLSKLLSALELKVSHEAGAVAAEDELLVVDGRLRERRDLPNTLGYVKTQHSRYLEPPLVRVVTGLAVGHRTPVFSFSGLFSWYLRLPGPVGSPWSGIVRLECADRMTAADAIRLAGVSAATLPGFASSAYKDPRAPQNLIPIAGLERRLRGLLGDPRLLQRTLRTAVR
ncbi:hypothetical protein GCM10023322_15880 [Rugosimonospora acidiphila]|uniref:NurA domain-containing protein n=1 Tax=Rugosimonospora acidiphila TaxID=556531 RepID=A0ABP9RMJ1_9ACTN